MEGHHDLSVNTHNSDDQLDDQLDRHKLQATRHQIEVSMPIICVPKVSNMSVSYENPDTACVLLQPLRLLGACSDIPGRAHTGLAK